jgi:hypothetical protein
MSITGNTSAGIIDAYTLTILNEAYDKDTMRRGYLCSRPVSEKLLKNSKRFLDTDIQADNKKFIMRIQKSPAGGFGGFGANGAHNASIPPDYEEISIRTSYAHLPVTVDMRTFATSGLNKQGRNAFINAFAESVKTGLDSAATYNEINWFADSPAQLGVVGSGTSVSYDAVTGNSTITNVSDLLCMVPGTLIDIWDSAFTTSPKKQATIIDRSDNSGTGTLTVSGNMTTSVAVIATDKICQRNMRNQLGGCVEGFRPSIGTTNNTYPVQLNGVGLDRSLSANSFFRPTVVDASSGDYTGLTFIEVFDRFITKMKLRWPNWKDSYSQEAIFVATNDLIRGSILRNQTMNPFGQYVMSSGKAPDIGVSFKNVTVDGFEIIDSPYCFNNELYVVDARAAKYGEIAMGVPYKEIDGNPALLRQFVGTCNLEAAYMFSWQFVFDEPWRCGRLHTIDTAAGLVVEEE